MKVVVIGGGIAGLTMGRLLMLKNIDFVICERNIGTYLHGHAFLMHTDGLSVLKELQDSADVPIPGQSVDIFSLMRPAGNEIKRMQLNSWQCMKRTDLISFLFSLVPKDRIREGRAFSHFLYEKEKIVGAAFLNGDVEYGDIFVGADGSNSKVRELTHGRVKFSPVEVKEVVGVAQNPELAEKYKNLFQKFQRREFGWSFGMIPTGNSEFVWFMQYDPNVDDVPDASPEELKDFCLRNTKDFPPQVHQLLNTNDFNITYPWNTRDFDVLPSFHRKNVVLIGDAAHVALPFTSAGTTNAILDAKTVMAFLEQCDNYEEAFRRYHETRSEAVATHVNLGRDLKKLFLNPPKDEDNIPVPLIEIDSNDETLKKTKPIQILYFTDPLCSGSAVIHPVLRKIGLEYFEYVNIDYKLVHPSYAQTLDAGVTEADAYWKEFCQRNEMLPEGDIWVEDILEATFSPSVVFKAVQQQGAELAILFLRKLKDRVFRDKVAELQWELLEPLAFETGVDIARLLKDFGGKAQVLYRKDLELAKKLNINDQPALHFFDKNDNTETFTGAGSYDQYEEAVMMMLPDAGKAKISADPKFIFSRFTLIETEEYAQLTDTDLETAEKTLKDHYQSGQIDRYVSNGKTLWVGKSTKANK